MYESARPETEVEEGEQAHDSIDLGMRFICRREDGDFWYVQIRIMTGGKRYSLPGKSFYDRNYGSSDAALAAAVRYRDQRAYPFFRQIGYTLAQKKPRPPRIPKFKKRKEAQAGLMANLHYIHLYKRKGKYTRCVVDVSVNVHGSKYHSTAYSYDFAKYGGKTETLRVAKQDRNKLAQLVHQKALELNMAPARPEAEIKRIIKSIRINRTPPTVEKDPDKFIKRSHSNDYWIVHVRKKLWGTYYRAPSKRFYDADYGGKHKSRLRARHFSREVEIEIENEFRQLRNAGIRDPEEILVQFRSVLQKFFEERE
ncbi:MAG: hypothetical protein KDH97_07985 [Calditrichaeota bacterium]|nr:hypothetical protein [Calditrichota bacterium]MCB9087380.1 hypothetical protein [Calditrichia bacterium]MCB0290184.1 hypothetical protein [Calditrichota bacterium]MCB0297649.1 hypothetical protein [Calditrichota bacterium]MCB0303822.1 hypothetical protein [Calditrichota bacterium]